VLQQVGPELARDLNGQVGRVLPNLVRRLGADDDAISGRVSGRELNGRRREWG